MARENLLTKEEIIKLQEENVALKLRDETYKKITAKLSEILKLASENVLTPENLSEILDNYLAVFKSGQIDTVNVDDHAKSSSDAAPQAALVSDETEELSDKKEARRKAILKLVTEKRKTMDVFTSKAQPGLLVFAEKPRLTFGKSGTSEYIL